MPPDPNPERGNEPRARAPEAGAAGGDLLADPVNDTGAPLSIGNRYSQQRTRMAIRRTRLALERTGLAQERTLMGWVRTCFSIIGFGFTIFAFFLGHRTLEELAAHPLQTKIMCVSLTLGGTLFMALAVVQYRLAMAKLYADGLEKGFSMATFTSVLVCAAGLLGSWVILAG